MNSKVNIRIQQIQTFSHFAATLVWMVQGMK